VPVSSAAEVDAMQNWFPFFSMLFWCVTKLMGLGLAYVGLQVLVMQLSVDFTFAGFLFGSMVPLGLGALMLLTEVVFDVATAEMRSRHAPVK
jgi:hypothetical protein